MNGSDYADKQLLKERYDETKEKADRLKDEESDENAAEAYRQAAGILEQIAEKENSDYVAEQRRKMANTLRRRADTLDGSQAASPSAEEEGEISPDSSSEPSGSEDINLSSSEDSDTNSSEFPSSDEQSATKGESSELEHFTDPPDITLSEVGGLGEEIDQIRDGIIKPHSHPEVYKEIGVDISNGVLLYGPPGTGKTRIAKAVANELDEPFAGVDAAELGSEYVNVGAQNIKSLFEEARQCQPCVIFIDELDSLARSRSGGPEQTDGSRQMITQLLQELQSIAGTRTCVIGATNLVEDIDSAIRRSGRFDRKIKIGAPDEDDRWEIFEIHLEDKLVSGELDLDELVANTSGFSGADIATAVKRAGQRKASRCIDRGETDRNAVSGITQEDLLSEIDRIEPGIKQWEAEQAEVPW